MTSVFLGIGVALVPLVFAGGFIGFWRGLSLKANDPPQPPWKGSWWRT